MGLGFQVKNSKVCHTPLKDKCEAIRNLESNKQGHFVAWSTLSSFFPNLQ